MVLRTRDARFYSACIRNLELDASRARFQIAVAVGIELNRGEAYS